MTSLLFGFNFAFPISVLRLVIRKLICIFLLLIENIVLAANVRLRSLSTKNGGVLDTTVPFKSIVPHKTKRLV